MAVAHGGFRAFLIIWLGELVSVLGSGLTGFGMGIWVYEQTREVEKFAYIALVTTVPGIVLSPFLGAVTDRFDRRKLLIVANCGAGLAILALYLFQRSGALQLWHIYLFSGISSAFGSLLWPAMTALVSQLVEKDQLGRASGLISTAEAFSMILAPVLGAVMLASLGLSGIFLFDAVSFGAAIFSCLLVRTEKPKESAEGREAKGSFFREVFYGFPYVFARPGLLGLMGFFMMVNFAGGYVNTLFAPLILQHYSKEALGIILGIGGIAMLAGGVLMGIWGGPKKKVNGILAVGLMISVTTIIFALPPNAVVYSVALAIGMLGIPIVNGCSQAIWQRKIPHDVQGRVFAVRRFFAFSMSPIAFLSVGPLADRVFEPGMKGTGWLSERFGSWFGHADGSGMRVMMFLFGILMLVLTVLILEHPRVQNIEVELPDAVPDES